VTVSALADDDRHSRRRRPRSKKRARSSQYARHEYSAFAVAQLASTQMRGIAIAPRPDMTARSSSTRDWTGRILLTIVVGCGAAATILCVSAALNATDQIVRVDNAVAELSHFIADAHASIRERVTTLESIDRMIAAFDAGAERRIARIRSLNVTLRHIAGAGWTRELTNDVDVRRIDEERRQYVTAATTTAATATDDRAISLRRFDLHAQKLIQTIEAARDSAETARARALADADAMVVLAAGFGVLVIAYLVWRPRLDRDSATRSGGWTLHFTR
jgi:hypothetical protein